MLSDGRTHKYSQPANEQISVLLVLNATEEPADGRKCLILMPKRIAVPQHGPATATQG